MEFFGDFHMPIYVYVLVGLFAIFTGLYGIRYRRTSKKGSNLIKIGIANSLIFLLFSIDVIGFGESAIHNFILILFTVAQIFLFYGAYKNYRAYEKQLADWQRGIF